MKEIEPLCFTLSNGVRIVYLYKASDVSHLGFTFLAGSKFEQAKEVGLAHFLEHCVFKGTEKRKAIQVLSRLDDVGGELNAFTAKEEICLHASFTKKYTARAIDLLADISLRSSFPDLELNKEKEVILDELNSYLDSPSDKIFDDFEALLFQNHSLGTNILGTKESVASFTRAELLSYIERFFFPENMVISFVGDVPISKLTQTLEKDFGGLKRKGVQSDPAPFSGYVPFKKWSKEANFQAHAVIGGLAPGYNSEQRRGMTLLTNVLGGPALNSRLILSVREKYGYSYSIEANYTPFVDTGYWAIYFGTDQKYLSKTLKLVYKEIKLMRENALSEIQLKKAKEQLKGHLALSLDSNSGIMLGLGKSLLLFNQIDSIQEIYGAIDKLSISELRDVAAAYFDHEKLSELVFEFSDENKND